MHLLESGTEKHLHQLLWVGFQLSQLDHYRSGLAACSMAQMSSLPTILIFGG